MHYPEAYATVRQRVVEAGLLRRAYRYYLWRTAVSYAIMSSGIALAFAATPWGAQLASLLIAFGSVQVGLIGHDAGHRAVFRRRGANATLGSTCWSLTLG